MYQRQVAEHLIHHQIKPSLQRIAIMEYLMNHATHPTVDTIFNDLYSTIPTLSKTTVYNTLKLFVENGAAQMLTIDERNIRYDADITPHAHFRCITCGEIYDILLNKGALADLMHPIDFKIEDIQIYYKGYCKKCLGLAPDNISKT